MAGKNVFILFFFLFTEIANGQLINSVGIKSGLSIANQTWVYQSINLTENYDYQVGFYGGSTVEFFKAKYFSYVVDMGFCQKGNKQEKEITTLNQPEGTGFYETYHTRFNYLTISPVFKARLEISHWLPFIFLGPRLDYQVSYISDFNLKTFGEDFDKTIWGLSTGGGIEYKRNKIGIITEFQYQYDFEKVLNTPVSIKNNAFIISMGIKYYFVHSSDVSAGNLQ